MASHAPKKYSEGSAKLVYGIDATGRILHVSEVESGSACGCRCPACDAPLNARKGPLNVHHFGHDASWSCANGPESALHKLAKEIVATERQLYVPAVKVHFRGKEELLHVGKVLSFDNAVEESRLLQAVIPDIRVEREGRSLFIEIHVTHACDEIKRNSIRQSGIAALEIDLSRFPRDASRDLVRQAVIEQADRKWLFHPQIDARIAEMRAAYKVEEDARRKQFDDEITKSLGRYDKGLKDLAARKVEPPDTTKEFFKLGLGIHIGCALGGAGGFTVTEREWQYHVLRAFIPKDGERRSYRHQAIFEWIKKKGLLRTEFKFVSPDLEEGMRERNAQFLSPYRAIEAYLDEMVARGVLRKFGSYALSAEVSARLADFRESIERKKTRRRGLVERIEKIVAVLPEAELEDFSLNDWITMGEGLPFAVAIDADDDGFDAMLVPVRKIESMIFRKGPAVIDLVGLPLGAEQTRQMDARKREADEKEAAKLAEAEAKALALRKAAEDRGEALRSFAIRSGPEWISWIDVPNPELYGMTPMAAAMSGDENASQARHLLRRLINRRAEEEAAQAEIQRWKSELEREVFKILKEKTQPFLDSPFLIGASRVKVKPRAYCVSKETFEECLTLAKSISKKRR